MLKAVDCVWLQWQYTGACKNKCGAGTRTKTRTKIVAESNGGACPGESVGRDPCQDCYGKIFLF